MRVLTKATALAVATVSLAGAMPALAAPTFHANTEFAAPGRETNAHSRDRYGRGDYRRGYGYHSSYRDGYCQPARKTDPLSAPNIDPTFRQR
ncbi:hypothetical protein ACFFF8_00015, partial [Novosphingobium clariflavum]